MLDRRPQTVLMAEMTWPEYAALVAGVARRRNSPIGSHLAKKLALKTKDHRIVRVAQASSVFAHRVQH